VLDPRSGLSTHDFDAVFVIGSAMLLFDDPEAEHVVFDRGHVIQPGIGIDDLQSDLTLGFRFRLEIFEHGVRRAIVSGELWPISPEQTQKQ
jgi:hypothetical protein